MLGWNSYSLSVFGGDTLLSSVVQQTFSVKGQTVSILGFVGRQSLVAATQLSRCSEATARHNCVNSRARLSPARLYKNRPGPVPAFPCLLPT